MRKFLFVLVIVLLSACNFNPEPKPTEIPATEFPTTEIPAPTDHPDPSPTPEVILTYEPQPTPNPVNECLIGIAVQTLYVRPGPANFTMNYGAVHVSDTFVVYEVEWIFRTVNNVEYVDEWARIEFQGKQGWIAVYYLGDWYAQYHDRELCLGIRFGEPPEPTPVPTSFGIHALPDAKLENINASGEVVALKTLIDGGWIGQIWKNEHPEGIWVHREMLVGNEMRDCPLMWEWYSPTTYAEKWFEHLLNGPDYHEFMNECGPPNGDWDQFARFTVEVLRFAGNRGVCALWGSFAPGNPDLSAWKHLNPVFEFVDNNPCRPNMYHGLAVHLSFYSNTIDGAWINNPWVAGRMALVDSTLKSNGYPGLNERKGGVWVTEAGVHDGYSGTWQNLSDIPCDKLAEAALTTEETYQENFPYIVAYFLWTYGNARSKWTDVQGCAEQIRNR